MWSPESATRKFTIFDDERLVRSTTPVSDGPYGRMSTLLLIQLLIETSTVGTPAPAMVIQSVKIVWYHSNHSEESARTTLSAGGTKEFRRLQSYVSHPSGLVPQPAPPMSLLISLSGSAGSPDVSTR